MLIESIYFENFRNYSQLSLEFQRKINIFIGENGEGKTNILEGIYLFSHLKSFRDNSENEILKWEKNYYYLKLSLKDPVQKVLEIGYSNEKEKKKKLKINGTEISKKTEFIGELKNITFLPSDLKILESPYERRRFLDSFLCSIKPIYLETLLDYNKILKHRNKLLKTQVFSKKEIDVWDKMLAEKGKLIQEERQNFLEKFKTYFSNHLKQISHSKDEIEIKYLPNVNNPQLFLEKLESKRETDLKLGYTSVGIHRDDFFLGYGDKEINSFGSQGQKRSVVLSLKASLFEYTYETLNEKPILLVDDIIRELDVRRRNDFLKFLNSSGQVFFTTTDLDGLQDYIYQNKEDIQIFKVHKGSVVNYEG